jgi:hypothetical protein
MYFRKRDAVFISLPRLLLLYPRRDLLTRKAWISFMAGEKPAALEPRQITFMSPSSFTIELFVALSRNEVQSRGRQQVGEAAKLALYSCLKRVKCRTVSP